MLSWLLYLLATGPETSYSYLPSDRSCNARPVLSKLLRVHTSKSEEDPIPLADYVDGMQEGQKGIYYIAADSLAAAAASPFVEQLQRRGLEVLPWPESPETFACKSGPKAQPRVLRMSYGARGTRLRWLGFYGTAAAWTGMLWATLGTKRRSADGVTAMCVSVMLHSLVAIGSRMTDSSFKVLTAI